MITFGFAVGLMVFAPTFMDPYDTLAGQMVLFIVGGLFAAALWSLVQLGRPVDTPRVLAGIEEPAMTNLLTIAVAGGCSALRWC